MRLIILFALLPFVCQSQIQALLFSGDLAAPSELTASSQTDSTILLGWEDNSIGENGFKIERSIDDNLSFSQIAIVGPGTTSYTDTIDTGTTFYYRVRAFRGGVNSNYSNTAFTLIAQSLAAGILQRMSDAGAAAPDSVKWAYIWYANNLQSSDIDDDLDYLRVYAIHDSIAAEMNWIRDSFNVTPSGGIDFVEYQGFKSDRIDGYLNTNYEPSADAVNMGLNDAFYAVWPFTGGADTLNWAELGANNGAVNQRVLMITSNPFNAYSLKLHDASTCSGIPVSGDGFHLMTRSSSTGYDYYYKDSLVTTCTATSTNFPGVNIYEAAQNNNGTASGFSIRRLGWSAAGAGSVNNDTLYEYTRDFLSMIGAQNNTEWHLDGDPSGYSALSGVNQVIDTIWAPSSDSVASYNHHPFLTEFGSKVYAMFSTHDYDEEGPGIFARWSYSSDYGDTWSTPDTLAPPQDSMLGRVSDGRVIIPAAWATVGGKLYAILDINDRLWDSDSGARVGVGMMAVEIDTTTLEAKTPFWFINKDGTQTAPTAVSGFDSYVFNSSIGSDIANTISDPENHPVWAFGAPSTSPIYDRGTFILDGDLAEPDVVQLNNGLYLRIWRRIKNNVGLKVGQLSIDKSTWGTPFSTSMIDWQGPGLNVGSRSSIVKATDFYFVGNGATTNRTPLFIAKSGDGLTWNEAWEVEDNSDAPQFGGSGKSAGVQYPDIIELSNGQLLVIYSQAKEFIKVSRFDKP